MSHTTRTRTANSGALRCADYLVHSGAQPLPFSHGLWTARRWIPARAGSSRGARPARIADAIIGSYAALLDAKEMILEFAADDGQEIGDHASWDVHHLVEGSVYADVHVEDTPYAWMYANVLPCVLVSAEEHQRYFHSVTRSRPSIELYGVVTGAAGGGDPATRAQRAWEAYHRAKRTGDDEALEALRSAATTRATMLDDLHHYDPVLRAITANVFRRVLERLDAPAP